MLDAPLGQLQVIEGAPLLDGLAFELVARIEIRANSGYLRPLHANLRVFSNHVIPVSGRCDCASNDLAVGQKHHALARFERKLIGALRAESRQGDENSMR